MLKQIIIENYKSIKYADLSFGNINVLIGENGAGKSNLISFIELCQSYDLNLYIRTHLGMNRLLHGGAKKSNYFSGTLIFKTEPEEENGINQSINTTDCAFSLKVGTAIDGVTPIIVETINKVPIDSIKIYHFCDTGDHSAIRGMSNLNDNDGLKKDGSNLASVLYLISQTSPQAFRMIEATMRRVAPYFQCFDLKPDRLNPNLITIEWKEVDSDLYHDSTSFSDGSIRFLALCTLLLQPNPPATIIIDEPELGLHPSAISVIGALIRRAAYKTQIIVATQSADLISEFSINEITVIDRIKGQSVFHKLKEEDFQQWVDTYTLGEIWKKNIIGGRP